MISTYVANVEELNNSALFERLYASVPEHRRQRVDRMRFDKDKRLSLGVWGLLQKGLKDWGICDKELTLSYGENGKPFLKDYPAVFFNLSHSGERVMCAIADCEVGCDVERIRDTDFKIAKRFFHEEEYGQILRQSSVQKKQEMFYRYWTLKESFLKVTGQGMKLSLDEFMIDIQDAGIAVKQCVNQGGKFFFREYDLQDGYRYACCAEMPDFGEKIIVCSLSY
ncbi:MAG: 4'-phosphopantetheinyl transferase family protein [Suilimivivens sp.]|nr:4'-phosphopantetheinyl transferase superfamily protein [Lachnospiraceae bacterium]MDY5871288.1 4'-phosphopantetheinyl transferase superfamily protein [Lachnospiraceae bacterium]